MGSGIPRVFRAGLLGGLCCQHEGCVHGKTEACPAIVCLQQALAFLFLLLLGGQGSCMWGWLLCKTPWNDRLASWPPLVQLWENVESEFSGNLEHLQFPSPKRGFYFTWKIVGKTWISLLLRLSTSPPTSSSHSSSQILLSLFSCAVSNQVEGGCP